MDMKFKYRYGGKKGTMVHLNIADDLLVVRAASGCFLPDALHSESAKDVFTSLLPVIQFFDVGVSVWQHKSIRNFCKPITERFCEILRGEKKIIFSGRALRDSATGVPVVYTENFFVQFIDRISIKQCYKILNHYDLVIKKRLHYAANAFFVSASNGTGLRIFNIASTLLAEKEVVFCHPELVREPIAYTKHVLGSYAS